MAITSTDIQEQSFKIEKRGYDVDEVDVFLEHVADGIDQLNNENASLRTQLTEARKIAANKSNAVASTPTRVITEKKESKPKSSSDSAAIAQKDAQIAELEARLQERKNEDAAIAQALIVAQRTGDEIVSKAKADGEQTKINAEEEARRILDKANAEKERIIESINELNNARAEVRVQYQDLLKEFISSATKRLSEIGGDASLQQEDDIIVETTEIEPDSANSSYATTTSSSQKAWKPSRPTATYTTPTVTSSVVTNPATPKPSVASKDLSGYGDADDTFAFDEID